jgi:hypothetical protein
MVKAFQSIFFQKKWQNAKIEWLLNSNDICKIDIYKAEKILTKKQKFIISKMILKNFQWVNGENET